MIVNYLFAQIYSNFATESIKKKVKKKYMKTRGWLLSENFMKQELYQEIKLLLSLVAEAKWKKLWFISCRMTDFKDDELQKLLLSYGNYLIREIVCKTR